MVLSETSNGQTIYYWSGLDLLAQSDGTNTDYLAYDGLGSVRQVTDAAGSVQYAQTFDPYGNLYSSSGTNPTKYAFTGEQRDTNGLLFLRARYYNASNGRFFQTDPSRKDVNLFVYVQDNPVNAADPTGHDCNQSGICQDNVEEPPYAWNSDYTSIPIRRYLRFDPPVYFEPLVVSPDLEQRATGNVPASDEQLPGYRGYANLCGPASVGAVLQNLLGRSGPTVQQLMDATIGTATHPGVTSEACVNAGCGNGNYGTTMEQLATLAQSLGVNYEIDSSLSTSEADDYFSAISARMTGSVWPIVLVEIQTNTDGFGTYKLTSDNAIRHWIVITGISEVWGVNGEWKWIRIYNPVVNGTEYYPAVVPLRSLGNPDSTTLFASVTTARLYESRVLWLWK